MCNTITIIFVYVVNGRSQTAKECSSDMEFAGQKRVRLTQTYLDDRNNAGNDQGRFAVQRMGRQRQLNLKKLNFELWI